MHVCLKVPAVWMQKYACRGRRSTLGIILLELATLCYESESLIGLGSSVCPRLASKPQGFSSPLLSLSMPLRCWDHKHVPLYLAFFFFKCGTGGWTHVFLEPGLYHLNHPSNSSSNAFYEEFWLLNREKVTLYLCGHC